MKSIYWAYIWAILVMIASFMPASGNIPVVRFQHADKIAHIGFYLILTWLLFNGLSRGRPNIGAKAWIIVGAAALYGLIIEVCQHFFFTGRHFEILDIIANIIGSIGGYLLFILIKNNRNNG